jgi:alpha-mannosidase
VLDTGAPFVRLRICGTNTARDHRLRLILNAGVAGGEVWADAAFGPVHREPLVVPPELTRLETPLPTAPLHRYVTIANDVLGATVFADGATEYEVLPDGRIAVTLFRGVGALSRPDLAERPGHAGWPADIPEAQCLGSFEAHLAVMLHGPRTELTIDAIERTADDVLHPLAGETVRALREVPPPAPGVELTGEGLAFAACKRSDDGDWMVLRCTNLLAREVRGRWTLPEPPRDVRWSQLDERVGDPYPAAGSSIDITAPPRGTVTLLVR